MNIFMSSLCIFIGGGLGATLRFLLSFLNKDFNNLLPLTLNFMHLADIISCSLIGIITAIMLFKKPPFNHFYDFISTGFLGGLSSFSVLTVFLAHREDYLNSFIFVIFELLLYIVISAFFFVSTFL